MAEGGGGPGSPNPAPEQLKTQVFVLRQVISLLIVAFWLLLFAGELVTQAYTIPFWFHCCAVGVLAYSLGLNVAELTAFRPPAAGPVASVAAAGARAGDVHGARL